MIEVRRRFLLWTSPALLFLCLCGKSSVAGADLPTQFRSALTSVGATQDLDARSDLDDPRKSGGFEAEGYFQNILIAKVSECTASVLKVFTAWSTAQSLNVASSTLTQSSALAFVNVSSPPGVLQLDYRYRSDVKRSRATLFYFSNDGSKHEPSALEAMLKQYKVSDLQDGIRTAVACH